MGYVIRTKFDGYMADGRRLHCKGGGGGPSPEETARAAAEERQRNVQAAQAVVDKYFTPQVSGNTKATAYTPGQTYYNADGSVYSYQPPAAPKMNAYDDTLAMLGGGRAAQQQPVQNFSPTMFSPIGSYSGGFSVYGNKSGAAAAPVKSAEQLAIEKAIASGLLYTDTKTVDSPFSDKWYAHQRQAYSDYYLPELEKQYKNAREQLEMNLAQTNPYGSSTNVTSMQRLEDEYNKQYSSLLQNADNFVADLRGSVADARTKAMSGAGDVSLATTAKQAADAAAAAASVPAFSPLGQLFANMVQPTVTGLSSAANQNTGTTSTTGGATLFGNSGGKGVSIQGGKLGG